MNKIESIYGIGFAEKTFRNKLLRYIRDLTSRSLQWKLETDLFILYQRKGEVLNLPDESNLFKI